MRPTRPEITSTHVRWFADYHAKESGWGVFHVSLDDRRGTR